MKRNPADSSAVIVNKKISRFRFLFLIPGYSVGKKFADTIQFRYQNPDKSRLFPVDSDKL